jgi:HD-GYP domain-containing protein (c-di-GMP phosphodiesterase class II)
VCILSLALASAFIKDADKLRAIGQAALLHDVGKIIIPHRILNKPTGLTEEERAIMRRHPVEGARLLEETEGIDALSVVVTFEHHRGYDLSGYPALTDEQPHPISLLIQITDIYDALTSERAYCPQRPPEHALAYLASQAGKLLEPRLVKKFIGMMGVFPPGSIVECDSGEIGIVEKIQHADLLRPIIRIIKDVQGKALPTSIKIDLREKNNEGKFVRSIIRSLEAQAIGFDKAACLFQTGSTK